MDNLAGKVAIVTGASSGIGEATTLALAAEGVKIGLLARRVERLNSLWGRISGAGGQALAVKADVANPEEIRLAISKIHEKWQRVDILVNNAGVMLLGPVDGADIRDWQRMINVNLLGLLYATHAVLPIMKTQKSGHIVNISSVSGRVASAGTAVYNASKWAVGGFSEALRQEVHKHGIRVTIVEPGIVDTELSEHITVPEAKERLKNRLRSMTPLSSQDIANSIVYACSQPAHVNVNELLIRPTDQE